MNHCLLPVVELLFLRRACSFASSVDQLSLLLGLFFSRRVCSFTGPTFREHNFLSWGNSLSLFIGPAPSQLSLLVRLSFCDPPPPPSRCFLGLPLGLVGAFLAKKITFSARPDVQLQPPRCTPMRQHARMASYKDKELSRLCPFGSAHATRHF